MGGKGKGRGKGKGKGKAGEGGGDEKTPTPLHTAARDGNLAVVTGMLAGDSKDDIKATDQHRRTPLHMAAFAGKTEVVECLLKNGADIGAEAMDGFLPLHFAAQQGQLSVLRAIISHVNQDFGAVKRHVNRIVRKGKRSALHLAIAKGHQECARFLVSKGASTELKTAQGQTALELCSESLSNELRQSESAALAEETNAPTKEPDQVGGAKPAQKKARVEELPDRPAIAGLPPRGISLDAASALAYGPWAFGSVMFPASAEKTYAAGVAELAGMHWEMSELGDDTAANAVVRCLEHFEAGETLVLHTQTSYQKMLTYTQFSDEGRLMPAEDKCQACAVAVIAETVDGLLPLHRRNEDAEAPGAWELPQAALAQELSATVAAVLREIGTQDVSEVLSSARVLGLFDAEEGAADGHRHILLVAVALGSSSESLCLQDNAGKAVKGFVQSPGFTGAMAAPKEDSPMVRSFQDFIDGKVILLETSRQSLALLQSMRQMAVS